MSRFMLFGIEQNSSKGGIDDLIGIFDTPNQVIINMTKNIICYKFHVFDLSTYTKYSIEEFKNKFTNI